MTRKDIVEKLQKEGLSEKTLSTLNDKQITELASRMLGEQVTKKGSVVMPKTSLPTDIKKVTDTGVNVELRETLKGNQKKLDKNHNGKIDSQDFKILKGQKKKSVEETEKPSFGLTAKKKSEVVKAAKSGKDIGKKGKGFKEVEKKAKESGADDPKAVAAAAMWKNIKRESVKESTNEVKNWVESLAENNYHPFTSKGEIIKLIQEKTKK
jgi:hypothetical protein